MTHTAASAARPDTASVPLRIRILRRLNPLIAALLRSPLHGAMSANLLVLSCRGRRSGKLLELPLSYVAGGDVLYLCTRTSSWWRNVASASEVTVVLRGRTLRMRPEVLDPATPEALDGFRRFLTQNPGTGELLYSVRRGPDGRPDESDLRREVQRSIVVRLTPAS